MLCIMHKASRCMIVLSTPIVFSPIACVPLEGWTLLEGVYLGVQDWKEKTRRADNKNGEKPINFFWDGVQWFANWLRHKVGFDQI